MLSFRLARKEDLEEVFQVAGEAFFDYDFFGNYEKNYNRRWQFVYEMDKICLLVNFRRNQLIVGEENNKIVIVIALHEPGSKQAGDLEYTLLGFKSVFRGCNFFKVLAFSMMDNGTPGVEVPTTGGLTFCVPVTVSSVKRLVVIGYNASGTPLFSKTMTLATAQPIARNHMYPIPTIQIN